VLLRRCFETHRTSRAETIDWKYRYDERIAILTAGESRTPTLDEKEMAGKEADEWEATYLSGR
jgi:hypothetical protein